MQQRRQKQRRKQAPKQRAAQNQGAEGKRRRAYPRRKLNGSSKDARNANRSSKPVPCVSHRPRASSISTASGAPSTECRSCAHEARLARSAVGVTRESGIPRTQLSGCWMQRKRQKAKTQHTSAEAAARSTQTQRDTRRARRSARVTGGSYVARAPRTEQALAHSAQNRHQALLASVWRGSVWKGGDQTET